MADVIEVAPGIEMIDTLLGGHTGLTAAYLIPDGGPTLVETGAQTSVETLREALAERGIGAGDLKQIVLTHIHLDHCGGVGDLADTFPGARIVVHRRGARHLADPTRLVASSIAVYGELAPMYGRLTPVPEGRIVAVEDGARIDLGPAGALEVIDAPGHARHQMAMLHTVTGAVFTGDALGVRFPGSEIYPTIPPPDFDIDMALATLDRIAAWRPSRLLMPHFGPTDDPATAIATAGERQRILADAAVEGWAEGGERGVWDAVARRLPVEAVVADEPSRERWRTTLWADNNPPGLIAWIQGRDARSAVS